jgi:hypothetical protein
MKNAIKAGVVGLGIAAAALLGSGTVHADTSFDDTLDNAYASIYGGGHKGDQDVYAYWNQLDQYGTGITTAIAEKYAGAVCDGLEHGMSEGQLVNISEQSNIPGSVSRLADHGAEFHFCPSYFEGDQ